MSDTQENPNVKIAALQIQLQVSQEGQARIATSLAEANEQTRALVVENQRLTACLEEVNASNLKLVGQLQEKANQVEEFRSVAAEKVDSEKELRDQLERQRLFTGHWLRSLSSTKAGHAILLPTYESMPKIKPDHRRLHPDDELTLIFETYEQTYAELPTSKLRKLLGA